MNGPEVWVLTWFCLFPKQLICRNIEGAVDHTLYSSREMCELIGEQGVHRYRRNKRLRLELSFVCTEVFDVYEPTPRPKRVRRMDIILPWPEVKYRLAD